MSPIKLGPSEQLYREVTDRFAAAAVAEAREISQATSDVMTSLCHVMSVYGRLAPVYTSH